MSKLLQGLRNLLLAALLLASAVCVTEVGLRGARWYRSVTDRESDASVDEGRMVIPGAETFFQLRPLSVVEREDAETGNVVAIRTNSFGVRGPEIELPKPPGVFRIVCLGDETTLAPGIPEEQTYCGQLQQLLQPLTDLRVEVINAGLPGGCPLTCELLLRQRFLGVQPDLILLHVDDSDVADDRLIRRFTRQGENGVPLAAIHPLATTGSGAPAAQLFDEFVVLDLVRNRLVDAIDSGASADAPLTRTGLSRPAVTSDTEVDEIHMEQALARLPQIRDLAAGVYCEFIVSRCPSAPVAATHAMENVVRPVSMTEDPGRSLIRRLAEITQENDFASVAAPPVCGPADPRLYLADGSELSAAGHVRYARSLARIIYERVPGVWTREPATGDSPEVLPLPGVARTPRDQ